MVTRRKPIAYFQSFSQSGSHIGFRGYGSKSTPPHGAKRFRIASTRSAPVFGFCRRALLRISLASCSIERPFMAARTLSFRFVVSSRFRIVMLAMQSMIALQSLIANRLLLLWGQATAQGAVPRVPLALLAFSFWDPPHPVDFTPHLPRDPNHPCP